MNSSDVLSPGADGDNDIDLSYEKVDAEARDVSDYLVCSRYFH